MAAARACAAARERASTSVLDGYARPPNARCIDASVDAAAAAEKNDRPPPPTRDDGVEAVDDEARLGGETATVTGAVAGGAVAGAAVSSGGTGA